MNNDCCGRGQLTEGSVIPQQVILGGIKKKAEQSMKRKSINSSGHGLSFSFCLEAPALTSLYEELQAEISSFLPR